MEQYLSLGRNILEEGHYQQNRTGVATYSVFGRELRFDLTQGFPAPTTKQGYFKGAVVELLWMLSGSTNVAYLHKHGVHFWDQWAIHNDDQCYIHVPVDFDGLLDMLGECLGLYGKKARDYITHLHQKYIKEEGFTETPTEQELVSLVLRHKQWKTTLPMKTCKVGDLGPVYGELWRRFPNGDGTTTDQIAELVTNLKTNPTSRRHVVSLWFPGYLPDESKTPQENVALGKQALAPCHWMFEVKVDLYTREERRKVAFTRFPQQLIRAEMQVKSGYLSDEEFDVWADRTRIPRGKLKLHAHLRSNDYPAGNPVNTMFYALLAHILAEQTDLDASELWMTMTDCHVYENQVEAFKEQLTREPFPLPTLRINRLPPSIFDYTPSDFELVDYQHHDAIKYVVAK